MIKKLIKENANLKKLLLKEREKNVLLERYKVCKKNNKKNIHMLSRELRYYFGQDDQKSLKLLKEYLKILKKKMFLIEEKPVEYF